MLRRIVPALLLLPPPVLAALAPLGAVQQDRVRCVAVLAVMANEQRRGVEGWENTPPLAERGAKFSDRVAETLVKEKIRSRKGARAEVIAQVAALQAEADAAADPLAMLREKAGPCIAMLDAEVPPPPPPTLPQCAAALAMAFEDEKAHQGMSKTARTLAIFAAVLDGRAREELKAAGRTEGESDVVIGVEKEKLLAEIKADNGRGVKDRVNYPACFEMARP